MNPANEAKKAKKEWVADRIQKLADHHFLRAKHFHDYPTRAAKHLEHARALEVMAKRFRKESE